MVEIAATHTALCSDPCVLHSHSKKERQTKKYSLLQFACTASISDITCPFITGEKYFCSGQESLLSIAVTKAVMLHEKVLQLSNICTLVPCISKHVLSNAHQNTKHPLPSNFLFAETVSGSNANIFLYSNCKKRLV